MQAIEEVSMWSRLLTLTSTTALLGAASGCVSPSPRTAPEPFPAVADAPPSSDDPAAADEATVKEKQFQGATVTHEVCHPGLPTGERPVNPEADIGISKPVGTTADEEGTEAGPELHYGCDSND
jgi:hypothetical protein